MPKIERWDRLPPAIRRHLAERILERKINLSNLNRLRLWIESAPEVPPGKWYKDFGFRLCGEGSLPKTFLLGTQSADGREL